MIQSTGGAYRGALREKLRGETQRELRGVSAHILLSRLLRCNSAHRGRQDGADGVDGADRGALHHGLPGDPTR